jgi:hypothetical protein
MRLDAPVRWLATHEERGRDVFRIGRSGDVLVAEWLDTARLIASRDGRHSELRFEAGVGPLVREKIERGSSMVLLRHLRGALGMHAGAVAIEGRAVVFLGRSGAGKSTAVDALCMHHDADLLADDAVAIDQSEHGHAVVPTERMHWLDARPGKTASLARRVATGPVPLRAFVELTFADGPAALQPMTALDAMEALVPSCARFVVDEDDEQRKELDRLSTLVREVPVVRLCRPRNLGDLEASHRPLVSWLKAL